MPCFVKKWKNTNSWSRQILKFNNSIIKSCLSVKEPHRRTAIIRKKVPMLLNKISQERKITKQAKYKIRKVKRKRGESKVWKVRSSNKMSKLKTVTHKSNNFDNLYMK